MKCPLCNQLATSKHHIKPRSLGGNDETRNLVYLCGPCHNEVEGLPFTPALIIKMRLKKLGSLAEGGEIYTYLVREGGRLFIGVSKGNERIFECAIWIPDEGQLTLPVKSEAKGEKYIIPPRKEPGKRGRPKAIISPDASIILNEALSLREKARYLGISYGTVRRRIKESSRHG